MCNFSGYHINSEEQYINITPKISKTSIEYQLKPIMVRIQFYTGMHFGKSDFKI
jgi:hypothetical protein